MNRLIEDAKELLDKGLIDQETFEKLRTYKKVIEWYEDLQTKFPMQQVHDCLEEMFMAYLGSEDANDPGNRVFTAHIIKEFQRLALTK